MKLIYDTQTGTGLSWPRIDSGTLLAEKTTAPVGIGGNFVRYGASNLNGLIDQPLPPGLFPNL